MEIIPKISVVMPAYNSGNYINAAIQSILNQTFPEFELIIINDGSIDNTEEKILAFSDKRIRYFKHDSNLGNNITRNELLNTSKGKYIAIMDSDDIAMPARLEKQYNYLEWHWETEILGTSVEIIYDPNAKKEDVPFTSFVLFDSNYLKSFLFFRNRIVQPTVMFRKEAFIKYNLTWLPEWENMGDYVLWYNASIKGLKIENLRETLLKYRLSPTQIGSRNIEDRNIKLIKFFSIRLENLGLSFSDPDKDLLFNFIRNRMDVDMEKFDKLNYLLDEIEKANKKRKKYQASAFKAVLLYHRLKLGKYYYLKTQKSMLKFVIYIGQLFLQSGPVSVWLFLNNEKIKTFRF